MNFNEIYINLIHGKSKLAVIGLGYVGLPLAIDFSHHVTVVGFDINSSRINSYKNGIDPIKESGGGLKNCNVEFTDNPESLRECNFIIAAVQTPVDNNCKPDFTAIKDASKIIGKNLTPGTIVVFESTVYPGVTENMCVPIIEKYSGLKCGIDWKIAYSPERINPGDRINTLASIKKIVSGMDPETTDIVGRVYDIIICAGTHSVSDIKTAEAIKVIENTQRDVNIAFMNEIAMICNKLGIDTNEVVEGMDTKWNALGFRPGLVGGHCIGVDPYYLIEVAEQTGNDAFFTKTARKINESIPDYVADETLHMMKANGIYTPSAPVIVLGVTFKENCPDIRNSKVPALVARLKMNGINPVISDPWADPSEVKKLYNLELCRYEALPKADCVIVAVGHNEFRSMSIRNIKKLYKNDDRQKLLIDVKSIYRLDELNASGLKYWRL